MERFIGIIGIAVLLGIAFLFSTNKKQINPRIIGSALALQFAIALFVFKTSAGAAALHGMTNGIETILGYSNKGISFVFGDLYNFSGVGFTFALHVLPIIIFVGALMAVLFHLGIMQLIMKVLGFVLRRVIGVNGVEALAASMNIFVGQDSAPFAVRPYLKDMPRSTLFLIMVTGMATVAGSILAGLYGMGTIDMVNAAGEVVLGDDGKALKTHLIDMKYLVIASFMAAPGGILMAKMLIPSEEGDADFGPDNVSIEVTKHSNVIEAAAVGATEGSKLAIIIGAMLIAFISLIALMNGLLGGIGEWIYSWSHVGVFHELTLQKILGAIFSPIMFLIGIPSGETIAAGGLFGEKLILNEFIAFGSYKDMALAGELSERAKAIMTIALCGFANFSSIAIVLGGVGTLAPSRRGELAAFGLKAVLAASLANLMSAAIVGLLL